MVLSNVIVDVTIIFLLAKVSAGLTNVSSLAFAEFGLVHCFLCVLRFAFVLDISKQSSQSGYRFVRNTYIYCKVVVYVR